MKKIIVTKITGEVIHNTELPSQEWLDREIGLNSWGKPARWLPDFLADVETRETILTPAQEYDEPILNEQSVEIGTNHVSIPAKTVTEYLYPAEYSYSIEDVTAQYENEQRIAALLKEGERNALCCLEVRRLIGGYNRNRSLTLPQINSMLTTFATINQCLSNDMPETALSLILAVTPDEVIITQQMLNDVVSIFAKHGFTV